ncbi:hypothetical protein BGZ73_008187 [Actinomortierella ambigua]|nr:hypothetical protein BGZ73_008187 [Actinomortierella ambigua]
MSNYQQHQPQTPIFILGARIGSGAYGSVHYARWGGDPCAAKSFFLTQSDYDQDEIQKEIQILRRLRHRNIIQFYRTCEHEGCTYLIMDLAENGSLAKAILGGREPLDWPTKTRIAHEIARGLEYIHLQNIWHRDLKSANVLLSRHMEAKLCDFGLAEVRSVSASRSTQAVKGTLRWMAPELLAAKPKYSAKSDIYALGIVMWEMAANCTRPFKDQDNNAAIAVLIKRGEREIMPLDTPTNYRDWVERCWHADPAQRPEARGIVLIDVSHTGTKNDTDSFETGLGSSMFKYLNARERRDSLDDRLRDMSISSFSTTSITSSSHNSLSDSGRFSTLMTGFGPAPDSGRPTTTAESAQSTEEMRQLVRLADSNDIQAQFTLATQYETGEGTTPKSDSEAFYWYLRAAKQGHLQAQYRLGDLFFEGKGTPASDTEAVVWYRRAAEQGHDVAQLRLGWMYANGRGVERCDLIALFWCRRAAEQGNTSAQMSVGWMCLKGQGFPKNEKDGAHWFREAAEAGDATAQNLLGTLYFKGRGVQQSDREAVAWYRRAAEQGEAVAQNNLGWMYENGRGVERDGAEAVVWYRKAAEQGEAVAQNSLGWMYEYGRGVERSVEEAASWYRKAALQGNTLAQTNLASLYKGGRGVPQSDVEAEGWYRQAAELGDATGQRSLALLILKRKGTEAGDDEAASWFQKAADQGDAIAQYNLGSTYYYGRGVDQSDADAIWWYQKAAEQGEARAQSRLALMYETGRGVKKDAVLAVWWYMKAAEQGEPSALYELGRAYDEERLDLRSNFSLALEYYRKAAKKGHAEAKERLQMLERSPPPNPNPFYS